MPVLEAWAELGDAALVERHVAGDSAAFDELCRRYRPRLTAMLRARTGDRHLAEDLAQETLVRVLRAVNTFDTRRPLWPWLRVIAMRLVVDHARSPYRRAVPAAPEKLIGMHEAAGNVEPEPGTGDDLVATALAALPPRQRLALTLRYLEDLPMRRVAAALGCDTGAAAQLLLRARRHLAAEYARLSEGALSLTPVATLIAVARRLALRWRVEAHRVASVVPLEGTMSTTLSVVGAAVVATALSVGAAAPPQAEAAPASIAPVRQEARSRTVAGLSADTTPPVQRLPVRGDQVDRPTAVMRHSTVVGVQPTADTARTSSSSSVRDDAERATGEDPPPATVKPRAGRDGDDAARVEVEVDHVTPDPGQRNVGQGWVVVPCTGTVQRASCGAIDTAGSALEDAVGSDGDDDQEG